MLKEDNRLATIMKIFLNNKTNKFCNALGKDFQNLDAALTYH